MMFLDIAIAAGILSLIGLLLATLYLAASGISLVPLRERAKTGADGAKEEYKLAIGAHGVRAANIIWYSLCLLAVSLASGFAALLVKLFS